MPLGTARRFPALGHGSREQVPLLHAEDAFPLLAEGQPFAQPASIRLYQRIIEASDNRHQGDRGWRMGGDPIVAPSSIAALLNEASLGEDFEMARDVGLRFFQRINAFTITELLVVGCRQEADQPQANRLTQGFEAGHRMG